MFRYRKLIRASVTSPFVVPGIDGYDQQIATYRTEEHLEYVEARTGVAGLHKMISGREAVTVGWFSLSAYDSSLSLRRDMRSGSEGLASRARRRSGFSH